MPDGLLSSRLAFGSATTLFSFATRSARGNVLPTGNAIGVRQVPVCFGLPHLWQVSVYRPEESMLLATLDSVSGFLLLSPTNPRSVSLSLLSAETFPLVTFFDLLILAPPLISRVNPIRVNASGYVEISLPSVANGPRLRRALGFFGGFAAERGFGGGFFG